MDGNLSYTVMIRPEDHMIFGGKKIGHIIKHHERDIQKLVDERGLKAWKSGGAGQWRALCADLLEFNRLEKERNLEE